MRKSLVGGLILLLVGLFPLTAMAHFVLLLPSDDIVTLEENHTLKLKVVFTHPMEGGPTMEMVKPQAFGVYVNGKRFNLLSQLKPMKLPVFPVWHPEAKEYKGKTATAWQISYTLKRPGDYQFYVIPQPYFEPAEEKFIWQMTKVVVDAFGAEEGWDERIGLQAEIIPLTRPYGLWAGNVFRGLVLMNGKPAPNLEVEVEYYNVDGKVHAPEDCMVTQVVKTDANGIFSYTIPWAGWWGFSVLGDGGMKTYKGKQYPVEMDAVIWIKAYPVPEVK
jgi:cobalt/nickel transport protein